MSDLRSGPNSPEPTTVERFVSECCDTAPAAREPVRILYESYTSFCESRDFDPVATNSFSSALTSLGFSSVSNGRERLRKGIRLKGAGAAPLSRPPEISVRNELGEPVAPDHLTENMQELWGTIAREYELADDLHSLYILTQACEYFDLGQQARQVLNAQGVTFEKASGDPGARPEVALFNTCRIGYAKMLRELGLDAADVDPTRPPRSTGNN